MLSEQLDARLFVTAASFARVAKDTLKELEGGEGKRLSPDAILCLQTALEEAISRLLGDGQILANHCRRATLFPCDLRVALLLRERAGDPLVDGCLDKL